MKKIIETNNAPQAIGPYSQAVLTNNTLYCSGQIAIDPKTNKLVNTNIIEETKQVIENIKQILLSVNMNLQNIVKCTIFLKSMNDYNEVNKVYSSYFTDNPPAREAVEVSKLPKDVNIEISVIATI